MVLWTGVMLISYALHIFSPWKAAVQNPTHTGLVHMLVFFPGLMAIGFFSNRFKIQIDNRKQIEHTLSKANEMFETIFDTTHFNIALLDRQFNFIRVNRAYADTCGHEPGFFISKNHFNLYPHKENQTIFENVARTGKPFSILAKPFEFPDQPERGVTYWDWTLHPVKDHKGDVEGLIFALVDVTRSKKAEMELIDYQNDLEKTITERTRELKEINLQLKKEIGERKSVENSQVRMQSRLNALWQMARMVDADFKTLCDHILTEMISMTQSQYAFLGFLNDDESRLSIISWSKGVMADCEMDHGQVVFSVSDLGLIGDAVRERKPVIVNQYDRYDTIKKGIPKGHVRMSNLMIIPVFFQDKMKSLIAVANKPADFTNEDLEEIKGFASSVQIVIERQRTEDNLKKSEERYRELVERTSDLIIRTDKTGNFIFVNHMSTLFFGLPPKDCIGLPALSFTHPDDKEKTFSVISRAIKDHAESMTLENIQVGQNGVSHTISWTMNLHYNEAGQYTGNSGIGRDITRRKKMEEDLIKVKKLEATGMLAGGIAHDFNNILFVVMGNIELIKTLTTPDEKTLKFLGQAEQATSRAIDLTRKFITFSSGGDPVKSLININSVILEVKDLVLSGSNIFCDCVLGETLPMVKVDKGQMHQVFSTLVDNAKQAMPDGGTLRIYSEKTSADTEKRTLGLEMEKGDYIKVVLSDNGLGIRPAHLEKVFDPYFSTRECVAKKGLGLGLSIVHSIMKKHKGYIHIESKWGEGTTVYLYWPASDESAATVMIHKRMPSYHPSKRLLLMDDEEQIRVMSREILEQLGYAVEVASSGEEAIRDYKLAMEEGKPFDAVLLDLTVKGGMGGIETIRHLSDLHPDVKAVILSGYIEDPVLSDFRAYGFRAAVMKPVAIPKLKETIENVLAE